MIAKLRHLAHRQKRKMLRHYSLYKSRIQLRRLDSRPIPDDSTEVRLFAMARNEFLRLPYFLDYYFSKGVDRVFFIDNGSDDGTLETALERDRVHVFQTPESFQVYYNWMELLLKRYGLGHWCVAADLDEILLYPHIDSMEIPQFAQFLEQQGFSAYYCLLLDMYSMRELGKVNYQAGEDPLGCCAWYDRDADEEYRHIMNERTQRPFETVRYHGGMRRRVFDVDANLAKVPLFRYEPQTWTAAGMHAIDGARNADMRGIVLHFKYLQDFIDRTLSEAQREQHANGAALYKATAEKLVEQSHIKFAYEGSRKLEHWSQLQELGVMNTTPAYAAFCREQGIA